MAEDPTTIPFDPPLSKIRSFVNYRRLIGALHNLMRFADRTKRGGKILQPNLSDLSDDYGQFVIPDFINPNTNEILNEYIQPLRILFGCEDGEPCGWGAGGRTIDGGFLELFYRAYLRSFLPNGQFLDQNNDGNLDSESVISAGLSAQNLGESSSALSWFYDDFLNIENFNGGNVSDALEISKKDLEDAKFGSRLAVDLNFFLWHKLHDIWNWTIYAHNKVYLTHWGTIGVPNDINPVQFGEATRETKSVNSTTWEDVKTSFFSSVSLNTGVYSIKSLRRESAGSADFLSITWRENIFRLYLPSYFPKDFKLFIGMGDKELPLVPDITQERMETFDSNFELDDTTNQTTGFRFVIEGQSGEIAIDKVLNFDRLNAETLWLDRSNLDPNDGLIADENYFFDPVSLYKFDITQEEFETGFNSVTPFTDANGLDYYKMYFRWTAADSNAELDKLNPDDLNGDYEVRRNLSFLQIGASEEEASAPREDRLTLIFQIKNGLIDEDHEPPLPENGS